MKINVSNNYVIPNRALFLHTKDLKPYSKVVERQEPSSGTWQGRTPHSDVR